MPTPVILTGGPSAQTGATLATYVDRLAETLGYYATGTITTQAASVDAERTLISDDLQSDQQPPEHADGLYVWIRNGAEALSPRKVVDGALDGSLGSLLVDRPYAAPLAVGTAFCVAVLPGAKYQGAEGLVHILNLALEQLPVIDVVQMTAVANQTEYSLTGYSWPIKRVNRVFYPRTSTTGERRREVSRGYWGFTNDADAPALSFASLPFSAGDTFEIELLRPANTWIKSGGTWGDSTGLAAEADEALYDPKTVVAQARPIALQRMALLHPRGSKERMQLEDEAEAAQTTAALARWFGGFRGSGVQSVGASGGSRGWSKQWTP